MTTPNVPCCAWHTVNGLTLHTPDCTMSRPAARGVTARERFGPYDPAKVAYQVTAPLRRLVGEPRSPSAIGAVDTAKQDAEDTRRLVEEALRDAYLAGGAAALDNAEQAVSRLLKEMKP